MHDPDLIIRTSGEQRTSNYLLWQSAYSELVFADELWPDFSREAFRAALDEFERRRRRSGALMEGRSRRRGTASERRAGRAARRNARSDLGARVAAAVPAIAFALVIIGFGNWVFVAGLVLLSCACLHELFAMYAFTNPSRLAGFTGAIALLVAAHVGDQASVPGRARGCVPWVFLLCLLQPRHAGAPGVAVTMLGLTWIGLALRPRGAAARPAPRRRDRHRRAGGDVRRRHGRLPRWARPRHAPPAPSISPNKTVEGLGIGFLVAVTAVWLAGLYQDWLSGWHALILGAAVAAAAPVGDLFESYLKRDAGRRTPGGCSAPTAAPSIASTRRCSRWSPASTSGTPCCSSDWTSYITSDNMPSWPAAVERPPPAVLKLC
jgi:phosphatidate cytidylyltransferase